MRLQFYPGMEFWYYISLLALFSLAFLIYYFVYSFANVKGYFLKTVWAVGTLIILILTPTGIFLGPPKPTIVDGGTVYLYEMNWPIAIPLAFFLCIVFSIFKIFINLIKEKGSHTPGLRSIILGCIGSRQYGPDKTRECFSVGYAIRNRFRPSTNELHVSEAHVPPDSDNIPQSAAFGIGSCLRFAVVILCHPSHKHCCRPAQCGGHSGGHHSNAPLFRHHGHSFNHVEKASGQDIQPGGATGTPSQRF
jgi:hypothetical protein